MVSEKQQLLREKRAMMEMLQAIQRDIEAVSVVVVLDLANGEIVSDFGCE